MIGCDIREMSDETRRILMNEEMIRINQDPLCRQPYKAKNHACNDKVLIYVKALADGDLAIGMFNLSDEKSRAAMNLDESAFRSPPAIRWSSQRSGPAIRCAPAMHLSLQN